MTDPIAQFIPASTSLFDDDNSGQSDRRQRNIVRMTGRVPGRKDRADDGWTVMKKLLQRDTNGAW